MRNGPLSDMSKEELVGYAKELEERMTIYCMELMSYEKQVKELEAEVEFFKETSMVKCPSCRTFRSKVEPECANCLFPLKNS
jgi:hypothetical protein